MPGFLTDAQLQDKVAATLKKASGAVMIAEMPYMAGLVADANAAAYQDIQAALLFAGYTPAQITAWDRGAEFQTDIGLFWALLKAGAEEAALGQDPGVRLRALDRRGELATVVVTNAGVIALPAVSGAGLAQTVRVNTDNDLYNIDTPTVPDRRRGRRTRW